MNMTLNIGDKVRFLNDVGGGTVAGFQRGGIVLVEDADGFEIPVREQEVVLVSSSESKLTREPVREEPEEQEEPVYRVKTILASKGAASSPHTNALHQNRSIPLLHPTRPHQSHWRSA